jgi:hypothetical protein
MAVMNGSIETVLDWARAMPCAVVVTLLLMTQMLTQFKQGGAILFASLRMTDGVVKGYRSIQRPEARRRWDVRESRHCWSFWLPESPLQRICLDPRETSVCGAVDWNRGLFANPGGTANVVDGSAPGSQTRMISLFRLATRWKEVAPSSPLCPCRAH